MTALPPVEYAPTTFLTTDEALLIGRPVCALLLFGCEALENKPTPFRRLALRERFGAPAYSWAVTQVTTRHLVSDELRLTRRGSDALAAFLLAGFSPPDPSIFRPFRLPAFPITRLGLAATAATGPLEANFKLRWLVWYVKARWLLPVAGRYRRYRRVEPRRPSAESAGGED